MKSQKESAEPLTDAGSSSRPLEISSDSQLWTSNESTEQATEFVPEPDQGGTSELASTAYSNEMGGAFEAEIPASPKQEMVGVSKEEFPAPPKPEIPSAPIEAMTPAPDEELVGKPIKKIVAEPAKDIVVEPKKATNPKLPEAVTQKNAKPALAKEASLKMPDSKPDSMVHSIIDFQRFSQSQSSTYRRGKTDYRVTLRQLNPGVNMWFLLESSHLKNKVFHLENVDSQQKIDLAPGNTGHLRIVSRTGTSECNVFDEAIQKKIKKERDDNLSYTSICGDKLYVRNPLEGRQTAKELVAEFLRDNIWGGEEITTLVKETIYKDKFLLTADTQQSSETKPMRIEGPRAALLKKGLEQATLEPRELGITLETSETKLSAGQWYNSKAQKGVYVSLYRVDLTPDNIMQSYSSRVSKLDSVESKALVISVALDMNQFELGFGIGTDHPRVNWSERIPEDRIPKNLPGPDGFDTIAPIVGTGKVAPHLRSSIIATFAAGFKRSHAAFKWGALSKINNASHYGWMEQGTLFSSLQPGLATVSIDQNGGFGMKTWTDRDNEVLLPKLRHARQNGVPIIDGIDTKSGLPRPGSLVNRWGAGNWSGSIDSKQRTLRAAMCHQKTSQGDFLIYSYFSTATPSAMARVFQAYHCEYAIHLDMNALEHTYFATYFQNGKDFRIEHLNTGMSVLDSKHKGEALPRFVGQADNRDYFYIRRKEFSQ